MYYFILVFHPILCGCIIIESPNPLNITTFSRIKDTLHVASDHTFGILFKPDEYSVGDLMHGRAPGQYLRGKDRIRGVVSAMRQHLKKANYHNFPDLMAAFRHYDLVSTFFCNGCIMI